MDIIKSSGVKMFVLEDLYMLYHTRTNRILVLNTTIVGHGCTYTLETSDKTSDNTCDRPIWTTKSLEHARMVMKNNFDEEFSTPEMPTHRFPKEDLSIVLIKAEPCYTDFVLSKWKDIIAPRPLIKK